MDTQEELEDRILDLEEELDEEGKIWKSIIELIDRVNFLYKKLKIEEEDANNSKEGLPSDNL